MKYRYLLHGMVVESDIPLEAESAPSSTAQPDLVLQVRPGSPIPDAAPAGQRLAWLDDRRLGRRHAVVRVDDGWMIHFPHMVEVRLDRSLTSAVAHLDPGFPEDLFAVLAAGFVVATVLQLRGDPVLHASAVEVDGVALAVVGPSGTGKSTTASLLCAAGARLVSDDVLRLSLATGAPRTWRGPGSTRLRRQASPLADGRVTTTSADGRTVARYERAVDDELELAAVLLPRPRHDLHTVEVIELTGMAALLPLVASPRILGWCDTTSLASQMQQLARLSAQVPVMEVHMPWGPPFTPSLGADVLRALRATQTLPGLGSSME